jgi:hypothetical protein
MRKLFGLLFFALLGFAVLSCTTTSSLITQDTLNSIRRGMPRDEFTESISPAAKRSNQTERTITPKSVFAVEYESATYPIEIYDMQTGTKTVTQYFPGMTVYHPMYPYGGYTTTTPGYTTTIQVPVSADYVFVFDKAGLIYWGFMNELQKEDDQVISALAPLIATEYENQKRIADEKRQKELEAEQKVPNNH